MEGGGDGGGGGSGSGRGWNSECKEEGDAIIRKGDGCYGSNNNIKMERRWEWMLKPIKWGVRWNQTKSHSNTLEFLCLKLNNTYTIISTYLLIKVWNWISNWN